MLTTNCLTERVAPVAFAALVVIILGRHNPAAAPTGYAPGPFAAVAAYCDISMHVRAIDHHGRVWKEIDPNI